MITYKGLSTEDAALFGAYPHPASPEVGFERRIDPAKYLAEGRYRPEWMWVAVDGETVVARMAFGGFPGDDEPYCVDWFEIGERPDRIAIGAELMRRAYAAVHKGQGPRPSYLLPTPTEWRGREGVRDVVGDRIAAAEAAGLSVFVERHGFHWTPDAGLPLRPARLTFTEGTDEDFVKAVADSYTGTLDAYTGDDTRRIGATATAEQEVGDLLKYPRGRDWWRLAHDADGSPVGAIFPAHTPTTPVIGYLAVLPGHRGKGYVDDLLAEMTHILRDEGAEKIVANTDLANVPMKAAFDRAGFTTDSCRIDLR
ncbi:GNAT family N-acetyltransferase [Phytomonospora endophytica]|uniref:RimJ/RimL family protein N-acetyltransferase n=1 Tax=Phytomonospora endophytica TaxID=714109 RepID=A0A841FAW6_9ACTN|nr:GNAT family N-acetyltransferase [Phytomonospora endophytica]MBB6033396.1 RimJ/RimL family protein N-acetyltransferase [Phytomonospora endophytica]GIG70833.1 N-acetyltransferase [Phytomonospora endophytica]